MSDVTKDDGRVTMYDEVHFVSDFVFKVSRDVKDFLNRNKITKDNIVAINFWYDRVSDEHCATVIYRIEV